MDTEVFDVYRYLLKHSARVQGTIMSKLLDSISSGLQAELDATMRDVEQGDQQGYMSHKTPLEMYAFLLQWFVTAAEKVKASDDDEAPSAPVAKGRRGRGGKAGGKGTSRTVSQKKSETWTWIDQIPPALALISKVLRLQTQRIWTTTAERDAFITRVFLVSLGNGI
jgi:condensin complex subunit 1